MNRILKSVIKVAVVAGITAYCHHKRKSMQSTAYHKTGKILDSARRKHKHINGAIEYRRQYRKELNKVHNIEKIKKLVKVF